MHHYKSLIIKLFIFVFLLNVNSYSQTVTKLNLSSGWQFRESGKSEWLTANVPGTVHTDLLQNRIIGDPFFGSYETSLQWIEQSDWEYQMVFNLSEEIFSQQNIELNFEGLDTYARVYLNDSLIIDANNMFRIWSAECKSKLKKENNKLFIIFSSAVKITDSIASVSPLSLPGGNSVYARKAPYHFGWDWGPRFVTCGIWRPVYISAWSDLRIEDVAFRQTSISPEKAEVNVYYFLNCYKRDLYTISVRDISNTITYGEKTDSMFEGYNLDAFDINLYNPRLWWTKELGSPELYSFRFEVKKGKNVIDEKIFNIGIRKIELIREKDSIGESFYFKLNGIPLFIKGANYIPQDNFLSRVTKEKYKSLIENCNRSNINMLRVWGGGVYEDDEFYSQCDVNGILVWQDFMFACAMYPGDGKFLENVRKEAFQNVSRLKNHPCIALWCGNNEIEEGWNNWGWQKQFGYSKKDSSKIWNDYEMIFKKILPEVVGSVSQHQNYISTSPKIGWGHPESLREGDSHYWGVWWGNEPFDTYKKKVPRFMSEYGFQGFPDFKTIESFTLPEDRSLYSDALKTHQKHPAGYETIRKYMEREYTVPDNAEEYVYISQLLQAYGIQTAIESHRRSKPYCMGTLYWQLNDCWPVVSWSGIDYYGRWKAMQYFVKDAYKDILVSPITENDSVKIFIVSDRRYPASGNLKVSLKNFYGKVISENNINITFKEFSSGIYFSDAKANLLNGLNANEVVLTAKLELPEGVEYINNLYFSLPKELKLPESPEVIFDLKKEGNYIKAIISSDKLVKNLFIYSDEDLELSNNYFDLIPGEGEYIYIKTDLETGELMKKIKYKYLNK
ncbi:MAG: glycoside hydrolase family 2 protein [Ignavibacteriae bacterium]|nr:glycoside hydrolase family 2 protein [Ignavibacteriota bacterium]